MTLICVHRRPELVNVDRQHQQVPVLGVCRNDLWTLQDVRVDTLEALFFHCPLQLGPDALFKLAQLITNVLRNFERLKLEPVLAPELVGARNNISRASRSCPGLIWPIHRIIVVQGSPRKLHGRARGGGGGNR